jgi:hypothetical protein
VAYNTTCLDTKVDIRPAHDAANIEGRDLIRFFLEQPQLPEQAYLDVSAFLRAQGDYLVHEIGIMAVESGK